MIVLCLTVGPAPPVPKEPPKEEKKEEPNPSDVLENLKSPFFDPSVVMPFCVRLLSLPFDAAYQTAELIGSVCKNSQNVLEARMVSCKLSRYRSIISRYCREYPSRN